jgi:hypothetical protein
MADEGQGEPWLFSGFADVLDEWCDRESPSTELELEVTSLLYSLQHSSPFDWLARRRPTDLPATSLCVAHLGPTGISFAYAEDRGERTITALFVGRSD